MKNRNKILLILTIYVMIIALSLNTSTAKTIDIYDAFSYNESGFSLSEQIQAIIDSAGVGDTINFLGNLYTDLTIIINQNLNIVTNVGTTIINSDSSSSLNTIFFVNGSSASGTTISGFNLSNNNTNGNGITINNTKNIEITKNNITANNSGIYVDKSSNITVDTNNIKNSDNGVYVKESADITIEKNTIEENNEGIYLENTNDTTVKTNNIAKNEKNGVTLKNTRNTVIENNNINQNKQNGIYSQNGENSQIRYNNIRNNVKTGILTVNSAKNLNIIGNNISGSQDGIRLDSSDNSGLTIKSNSIKMNSDGLSFGSEYGDHNTKDISSNDISQNTRMNVENKDSKYYGTLQVGPNWYGANTNSFAKVCPMLQTDLIQFNFVKSGNGVYTGTLTYNGQIMSDLPPMSMLLRIDGKDIWVNIENGKATIDLGPDFDEENKGRPMTAFLDNERSRTTIVHDTNNKNLIIGGTNGGPGGSGGSGPGGSGSGDGLGPGNSQGTGGINSGISGETSNPADAGAPASSGDASNPQSSQQQSQQAKEIILDDDWDLFRLDDVRTLTGLIIILLFGSIIMGYIIKKRTKKSLL